MAVHQHGNAIGEAEHDAHVVLDDDEGLALGQSPDQRHCTFRLGVAHAGGRLVQHHHGGAAGDRDSDLELALLGVGQ